MVSIIIRNPIVVEHLKVSVSILLIFRVDLLNGIEFFKFKIKI